MRYNVHAGHNPDGKTGCGAIGLIKESTESRKVKNEVIRLLEAEGHTVYDTTVDNGSSSNDVLNKIVAKCNAHNVDLDISIHFNSGAKDQKGNGVTTGTEVLVYKTGSEAEKVGERICTELQKLGLRNRGIKVRKDLRVLNGTKAEALLIEVCFVDDFDDVDLYNPNKMARAIVKGILNKDVGQAPQAPQNGNNDVFYRVCLGSFRNKANAEKILAEAKAKGFSDAFIATK